jgi:hypothetical protein
MDDVADQLFPSTYQIHYNKNPRAQHPQQHHHQHQQLPYYYHQSLSRNATPGPSTASASPRRHTPQGDLCVQPQITSPSVPTPDLDLQEQTSERNNAGQDQSIDDEPLYVNAKQYYRILKRRVARARLEEVHRLSRQRKVRRQFICSLSHCLPIGEALSP